MSKPQKVISYDTIKQIIIDCPKRSHRALLAFQFGFGSRVGELCREYDHWFGPEGLKEKKTLLGPTFEDVQFETDASGHRNAYFENKPNFKQHSETKDKMTGIVFGGKDDWLVEIIEDWVTKKDNGELRTRRSDPLFSWKQSRARSIIKKYISEFDLASHNLRHSRATYYGRLTGDAFAVKQLLGHSSINTSQGYVHYSKSDVGRLVRGETDDED